MAFLEPLPFDSFGLAVIPDGPLRGMPLLSEIIANCRRYHLHGYILVSMHFGKRRRISQAVSIAVFRVRL
jgi:hypothetical protein